MASLAAALTGSGTSKCGWPMLRLTGSLRLRASSKTLRMPDDSMCAMRSAIQRSAGGDMRAIAGGGKREYGSRRRGLGTAGEAASGSVVRHLAQPPAQRRVAQRRVAALHRGRQRLAAADQHDELLAARDAGVQQV